MPRKGAFRRQLRLDIPVEDPDDPQPGSSGIQRPASPAVGDSDWEWEVSDDEERDPIYAPSTLSTSSDEEAVRAAMEENASSDEEFECVSLHNSSIDSDTPLDKILLERNQPGSDRWAWKKRTNFPRHYGFSGQPGVMVDLYMESTAREVFDQFFPDTLWEIMVKETNAYAIQNPPTPSRKMVPWSPVTKEELQSYMAIRILMGIQPRPQYRDYWSNDECLGCDGMY